MFFDHVVQHHTVFFQFGRFISTLGYPMCRPPFREKSAPVEKPESSEASQQQIEAISSGVPKRLTGMVFTIFSSTSGRIARTISVPI